MSKSATNAYLATLQHLKEVAPEIATPIFDELKAQRSHLKMIASENYSSLSVQLAMGNLMTDKYAEGYPHHRFYAGCENVDIIEERACSYAKKLFGAKHAYVQPHSGADANLVAFWTILNKRVQTPFIEKLGKKTLDALTVEEYEALRLELSSQTLLGLSLNCGGHLTHGYRHNVSAKMFRAVSYSVDPKTYLLDYENIAQIARKEKPLILLAGFSAYSRRINFAKMREIADEVGAVLMVDMAHFAGLVAGKAFQGDENPIPFAHVVTSTTHKTLRGPRGGIVLCNDEFAEDVDKGCPMILGGPLPHVIAAKAIAFKEALQPEFRIYAQKVIDNARALAAALQERGIKVLTGGTDNHLLILDLSEMPITGRQAELALNEVGITVNRNMIPFDPKGAWYTAGIRIGTPALTTRGMGKDEMIEIAECIATILNNLKPAMVEKTGKPSQARYEIEPKWIEWVKAKVKELTNHTPLYPELTIEE